MSTPDTLLLRLSAMLPKFYAPLIIMLCIAWAWRPLTGGDDVWAHAAVGRWMVEHGQVPQETLFLWGFEPIPWVYHSWLSQLTFYGLMACGEYLLIGLTAVAVCIVFGGLWRAWSTRAGGASILMPPIFALAIYASSLRFHPRPELFTALFLAALLIFLSRKESQWKWPDAVLIFLLFVAWANFHGAVAIGLVMLAATAVCELCQNRFARPAWRWLLYPAVAAMAVGVNPYGLEYWQALRPVGGEIFQRIDEWKPFWKAPALNLTMILSQFLLVWLAVLAWLANPQRRWSQLAWVLVILILFLSARRHLWLLPIVSLAVTAANAESLSTLRQRWTLQLREQPQWPAVQALSRIAVIILLVAAIAKATPSDILSRGAVASSLPLAATEYFRSNKLGTRGRVFNDYENSSYLQWRFRGDPPLYIDLLNAYPDQLLLDYLDIANARPRGRQLLQDLKIETVMLRTYKPNSALAKLAQHLDGNKNWQRVYRGDDGAIWTRRRS